jgi:RIO kinase 1
MSQRRFVPATKRARIRRDRIPAPVVLPVLASAGIAPFSRFRSSGAALSDQTKAAPMRMPDSLAALVDYGIIQEVVRPLMSGKEAQVYLVVSEGEERVAKVYKEAQARTFKHRAEYTEGRKTRNSRDQRAISKRSRHGRAQDEAAWRSTEVDMIHRLRDAGVRVPEPHQFIDGVLVMELVKDAAGEPAQRLGDLTFDPEEAEKIYHELIVQVTRMLCAGVVHGDLSEFNVLMGVKGPTLIDFPQSIDPARNQNARALLIRDVDNLHRFLARFAPHARRPLFAQEMWQLYQANKLTPTSKLEGSYRAPDAKVDTSDVLAVIGEVDEEQRLRHAVRDDDDDFIPLPRKPLRTVVDLSAEVKRSSKPRPAAGRRAEAPRAEGTAPKRKRSRKRRPGSAPAAPPDSRAQGAATGRVAHPTRRSESGQGAKSDARPDAGAAPPRSARRRARRRRRPGARQPDPTNV